MEPDWSRESLTAFWDPPRQLLRSIRRYQASRNGLARRWWVLQHRFWSIVTGAELPIGCAIGGGLSIPHPNGVVVHADSRIGVNCLIMQQVTIGTNGYLGAPVIGDGVDIGPGAKVVGAIGVGDGAMIGALSFVDKDVAPDDIVHGIPARSSGRSAAALRAARAATLAQAAHPQGVG